MSWCSALPVGIRLAVQVSANARKTEVIGLLDDALKIRLQAQPVEGRANLALIRFLAEVLGVPRSAVVLTHGLTNKRKLIDVCSPRLTPEVAARLLGVA